ncbi:hypothetical protein V866_004140 [Kwoniella sp. B9012]
MQFAVLAAFIPLLGGASTSAIPSAASPNSLISPQTGGLGDVPAACTSECASTQEFAEKMYNFEGLSGDKEALLQFALGQVKEECHTLTAGDVSTSFSNSTTTDSAAISGWSASASRSATITLISATSIASSHAPSATSAASSAAPGASAPAGSSAAPSGNAGSGASARTAVGGVMAFIGAAVGLALLL